MTYLLKYASNMLMLRNRTYTTYKYLFARTNLLASSEQQKSDAQQEWLVNGLFVRGVQGPRWQPECRKSLSLALDPD
jgi:hypothetical protein